MEELELYTTIPGHPTLEYEMMHSFDDPKAHLFGFLLLRIQQYIRAAALHYSDTQNQPLPSLNLITTQRRRTSYS